jgi:poly(3-hydroxybutyrate) depolymerase
MSVVVDGKTRTFIMHVPSAYNGSKPVPMVVDYHPIGGSGAGQMADYGGSTYKSKTDPEGVISLYPDGTDGVSPMGAGWNVGPCCSRDDDVKFSREMIKKVEEIACINPRKIYATGFSNGGALSGALVSTYPDLLAGISAMGWMIPVRDRSATELKIPFLLIQGTQEFTQPTFSGAMAVMEDEKEALRDFFARNDLFHAEQAPDYDATPYWGYPADRVVKEHPVYRDMFSSCVHKGDVEWTISQYFHPDYRYPLAELILVENAGHVQHSCNARYAWDFFKHFARTEDGRIIELAE